MDFKLIIVPEAEIEISEAIVYYESKQQGLGSIFVQYLDGYFYTLVKGKAFFDSIVGQTYQMVANAFINMNFNGNRMCLNTKYSTGIDLGKHNVAFV